MMGASRFSLDGKVAIVTGGSRGLGREIARALADAGADVAISSRNPKDVEAAADSLAKETGRRVIGLAGDIGEVGVADDLVGATLARLGGLDILVNNAGINVRGAIDAVTPADYDSVLGTNLKGPWLLCRAAAPQLTAQRSGRVINIASALGIVGMADRSLYCASKGGLAHMTKALALEWATQGITVNAICPGPFETEMNRTHMQNPEVYQRFAGYTAMNRWGREGEIGGVAVFLASEAASYITGVVLPVDGGWVA